MLVLNLVFCIQALVFLILFLNRFFTLRCSYNKIVFYSCFFIPFIFRNRSNLMQNIALFLSLWFLCDHIYKGSKLRKFLFFCWFCLLWLTSQFIILLCFTQIFSLYRICHNLWILTLMALLIPLLYLGLYLIFEYMQRLNNKDASKLSYFLNIPYVLLYLFYIHHMEYSVFNIHYVRILFLYLIQCALICLMIKLHFYRQFFYKQKFTSLQNSISYFKNSYYNVYHAYSCYFDQIHDLLHQCLCLKNLCAQKQYDILSSEIQNLFESSFSNFQSLYLHCPILKSILSQQEIDIQRNKLIFDTTQLKEDTLHTHYSDLYFIYEHMIQILLRCCEMTTIQIQSTHQNCHSFLHFTFSAFSFDIQNLSSLYTIFVSKDENDIYHVVFMLSNEKSN